jgi:exodeoxyribonuclease-3
MKLATFNVNGINGRLPVLLRWLREAAPDVVRLQELKASQEKFPEAAFQGAGYTAIWHGQKSWNGVAILARGHRLLETRRGLPGDPDDGQSRYIEAVVDGIVMSAAGRRPATMHQPGSDWMTVDLPGAALSSR